MIQRLWPLFSAVRGRDSMPAVTNADVVRKIHEHLGKVRSCALMMSAAQSLDTRKEYLRQLSEQLKKAASLLNKLETE